jgi:hypothetical protein
VYRGYPCCLAYFRQVRLGEGGKPLKRDTRPLDHLLQIADELAIHRVVGSPESIQRRKASGVENPKHAQLLKAAFVDAPVFLLRGGAKPREREPNLK